MDRQHEQVWFVTGSQHLYGAETLRMAEEHSKEMAETMNQQLCCELVWKPIVTTAEEITETMLSANQTETCVGIIVWMHTFSPSKMWVDGLSRLQKPILHLHTQYNEKLPYSTIDMDFMNLNQSAHGDREHGFLYAQMRKRRKVVVGYWQDSAVLRQIDVWAQAALGAAESRRIKVCRFGDNMRNVAVTDGNRVSAALKFGWSVDYYGIGDLVEEVQKVSEQETDILLREYADIYQMITKDLAAVKEQARYEAALIRFLYGKNAVAFTTNFEDLHGLRQLPGLACQRLMEKGYGFGAEGDWKTAALLRIMKVMSGNIATAFMEDYTYHLEKGREAVLGAHMLEVCPTVAGGPIYIDVQPLDIGDRSAPARMVFDGRSGEAIAVSLIDLGDRYRMIVAEVEGIQITHSMPNLPIAKVMWRPYPNFYDGTKAWLLAGGAHHTVLSFSLTKEHMQDFARIMDIECVVIGKGTDVTRFEQDLMIGETVWRGRK